MKIIRTNLSDNGISIVFSGSDWFTSDNQLVVNCNEEELGLLISLSSVYEKAEQEFIPLRKLTDPISEDMDGNDIFIGDVVDYEIRNGVWWRGYIEYDEQEWRYKIHNEDKMKKCKDYCFVKFIKKVGNIVSGEDYQYGIQKGVK
jgi:hypothetical protein